MKTQLTRRTRVPAAGYRRQRGIVLPLVAVALLALLAVAGLSLDSSHTLANKTRLQNTVDAAALTAAKTLDETANTGLSTADALALFGRNADGSGNHEMNNAYDGGDISVTVQYSATLNPFVPGSPNGPYVRVIAQNFDVLTTLSRVLGINEIEVGATAVAGPSPTIDEACGIAPILVCADNMGDAANPPFGFVPDELRVLKPQPGDHDDVGPGNYKLLRLDCGAGGACVRTNMAGEFDSCLTASGTADTEPGVTAGPTSQGFNTRFGEYAGGGVNAQDHPPDVVTVSPSPALQTQNCQPSDPVEVCDPDQIYQGNPNDPGNAVNYAYDIDFGYDSYTQQSEAGQHQYAPPVGAYGRRVLALPVADCTGDQTGQSTIPIEGFACYFMLQPIAGGVDKQIFGQFVDNCEVGGNPGPAPGAGPGPYRIQLYKDPDSGDS